MVWLTAASPVRIIDCLFFPPHTVHLGYYRQNHNNLSASKDTPSTFSFAVKAFVDFRLFSQFHHII